MHVFFPIHELISRPLRSHSSFLFISQSDSPNSTWLEFSQQQKKQKKKPAKSPSLSEEHFLAINNNNSRGGSHLNLASKSPDSPKAHQTPQPSAPNKTPSPSSRTACNDMSSSSQNSSHIDELDSPLEDVHEDEFSDKSATLRAGQQLDTITVNTQPRINRFNSDKSIYYSSEIISEAANNSNNYNSLNDNENGSNNSSSNPLGNVSITFSPSGMVLV